MNKRRFALLIIIIIISTAVLLVCDYCNCLHGDKFNADFVSFVVGNAIVILLFLTTFYKIDSNNIKKEKNKRDIATLLLSKTYNCLKAELDSYKTGRYLNHQYSKCIEEANKSKDNSIVNSFIEEQERLPFFLHNDIFALSQDGVIEPSEYDSYIEIKRTYSLIIDKYFRDYFAGGQNQYYRNNSSFTEISNCIEELNKKIDKQLNLINDTKNSKQIGD